MGNLAFSVERTHEDVVTVRMKEHAGWTQEFLMIGCVHFDSPHSDRHLLRSLLDEAVDRGAGIMSFGDWFDAMQGRDDRRSSKGDLLKQYKAPDYINRLIDESAEFLTPYKDNVVMWSAGNHETAILKHLEVDLLSLMCRQAGINYMGYSGFVRFLFERSAGEGKVAGGRTCRVLYFHHGSGGGGEVTKGVMRAQRQAAYIHNADIYVGAHVHEAWRVEARRLNLSAAGRPYYDDALHISIPTLKDEYVMNGGYHVEKGRPPKPIGAFWLRFWHNTRRHGRISFDAIKAL